MSGPTGEVVSIPLASLRGDQQVRRQRLNFDHVGALAETLADLPPVTVRQRGDHYELIDGAHRVEAHRSAGESTVRAIVLDVDDVQALRIATEANVTHGRPLDVTDRKNAAARLLALNPNLSDREVAKVCGISHPTVAALRPTGKRDQLDAPEPKRTGGDGRERPATREAAEAQREKVRRYIEENPEASSREASAATGASKSTAASVKRNHLRDASATEDDRDEVAVSDLVTVLPDTWAQLAECRRSTAGRDFGLFMDRRVVKLAEREQVAALAAGCPRERVDAAVAQALRAAEFWTEFANELRRSERRMEVVR